MKTLEQNFYAYTESELKERMSITIDNIKEWSNLMGYRIIGNIDAYKENKIPVGNISKSKLKTINRYMKVLDKHMTLRNVNMFLHLIHKIFGFESVQIKKSEKEEAIDKARKEWKEYQKEANRLLQIYKNEKGNFYKEQKLRRELLQS